MAGETAVGALPWQCGAQACCEDIWRKEVRWIWTRCANWRGSAEALRAPSMLMVVNCASATVDKERRPGQYPFGENEEKLLSALSAFEHEAADDIPADNTDNKMPTHSARQDERAIVTARPPGRQTARLKAKLLVAI
jgi:hypothetical protein